MPLDCWEKHRSLLFYKPGVKEILKLIDHSFKIRCQTP